MVVLALAGLNLWLSAFGYPAAFLFGTASQTASEPAVSARTIIMGGCTSPLEAYPIVPSERQRKDGTFDLRFTFQSRKSYSGAKVVRLPCGRCLGCLQARGVDWATRITHEAKLHPESYFLTLTYSDERLPWDHSLSLDALQRFHKRARKRFGSYRHFSCGEYGSQFLRPHFHVIGFSLSLPDLKPCGESVAGDPTFTSAALEDCWGNGSCLIGRVTPRAAAYVAGYTQKKLDKDADPLHYRRVVMHPETGWPITVDVAREFAVMSRRPGLGTGWYDKFKRDAFPSDFLVIGGMRRRVPRFYVERYKREEPGMHMVIMAKRKRAMFDAAYVANNTWQRLAARTEFNKAMAKRAQRSLEAET